MVVTFVVVRIYLHWCEKTLIFLELYAELAKHPDLLLINKLEPTVWYTYRILRLRCSFTFVLGGSNGIKKITWNQVVAIAMKIWFSLMRRIFII